MAKLEIQKGENNSILRTESVPVTKFDKDLKKLVKDMKETMLAAEGLGLAAPQVGHNMRMFVLILNFKGEKERVIEMANPVILEHGEEVGVAEEGCLSLPGLYAKVERWNRVMVEFCDISGARQVLELFGLDAREVQHENDHLDGVLFVDRVKELEEDEGDLVL
ncbi:MAG: peptide deformylase [Nitrospirae bacterium]|nr:peptide deformylase [Nitrospirota bacterium]